MIDNRQSECYNITVDLRECWNWQTGTFEVRVLMAYGFKSRLAHQQQRGHILDSSNIWPLCF